MTDDQKSCIADLIDTYADDEVDKALKAFGKDIGRDMGWT